MTNLTQPQPSQLGNVQTVTSCNIPASDYYNNSYGNWFVYPYQTVCTEDRTRKAFNLIKMLIEKKRLKCDSIDKFIELVDEILAVI